MNRFSGNRVTLGCALYLAVAMGVIGIYITSIVQIPAAYGITITQLGTIGILMPLSCTLGSLALNRIKSHISAKGCLYLGGAMVCFQAIAICMLRGRLIVLVMTLITGGLVASLSAQTVMSDIIGRWFVKKRAERIALVLGASPFGSAAFQIISGRVLEKTDYFTGAFRLYLAAGLLMLLLAKTLIVSSSPEEVGQQPFGDTPCENAKALQSAPPNPADSLYKSGTFWLLIVATVFSAGNTTYIQSYLTTFFSRCGLELSSSSAILGSMSVCGGVFLILSGTVLSRLGVRRFLMLLVVSTVAANLGMLVFASARSWLVILLIVLFYGIGSTIPNVGNLISGRLFGQENAVNAASKCYAAYSGTNMLLQPICATVADKAGFPALYGMVAFLCGVSAIFYLAALRRQRLNG